MSKYSALPESLRFFSKSRPDLRSRASLTDWLSGHYRYDTMNSCNNSTAYANRIKIPHLGLTSAQEDAAYELLDVDDGFRFLSVRINEFTEQQGGQFTAGTNGRSGGYLVMYNSQYKQSEHKSRCSCCGQRNFRAVYSLDSLAGPERDIAQLLCSRNNPYCLSGVLADPAFMALGIAEEVATPLIRVWLERRKHGGFSKTCGRCGADAREPFSAQELQVWPGQAIDHHADFEDPDEWPMSRLQARARLVMAFDEMCDRIRADLIDLIGSCRVVTKTIHVPKEIKVLEPLA